MLALRVCTAPLCAHCHTAARRCNNEYSYAVGFDQSPNRSDTRHPLGDVRRPVTSLTTMADVERTTLDAAAGDDAPASVTVCVCCAADDATVRRSHAAAERNGRRNADWCQQQKKVGHPVCRTGANHRALLTTIVCCRPDGIAANVQITGVLTLSLLLITQVVGDGALVCVLRVNAYNQPMPATRHRLRLQPHALHARGR